VPERPPQVEDRCGGCDSTLFHGEDDRPESVLVRREAYEQSTAPRIALYREFCLLIEVEAKGAREQIWNRSPPPSSKRTMLGDSGPVAALD
jgi:adenylate kinase family enzyme